MSGHQKTKDALTWKAGGSKWDLGLFGSAVCSVPTYRPWCQALEEVALVKYLSSGVRGGDKLPG